MIAMDEIMSKVDKNQVLRPKPIMITAGSTYLDIDAYACIVAMAELLQCRGENAVAYSVAPCNYSVCHSLINEGEVVRELPADIPADEARYIIVDVSDPEFLKSSVPLGQVVEVYDHHTGFEDYWLEKIGPGAHIEFIGAAATLVYREWKQANLRDRISCSTALLLIAAILDNTLYLTSANTTEEDVEAFHELCRYANVGADWCASYFSEVQKSVECDLKNAIFSDLKIVRDNPILPARVAQLCIWNANSIMERIPQIREWFAECTEDSWMMNVIDLHDRCSYFICDDFEYQEKIQQVFDVRFVAGVARNETSYLRKEIIKKTVAN